MEPPVKIQTVFYGYRKPTSKIKSSQVKFLLFPKKTLESKTTASVTMDYRNENEDTGSLCTCISKRGDYSTGPKNADSGCIVNLLC